jgi:hypothetical protein
VIKSYIGDHELTISEKDKLGKWKNYIDQ